MSRKIGPAKARNNGVKAAQRINRAFLYDHCLTKRSWISEIEQNVKESGRINRHNPLFIKGFIY
jgi:hypothetical protein